jgi:hypothetical protein
MQGKVREILSEAVEGASFVLPDIVSLAAVEIALRHRLLDGHAFQPILTILQHVDSLAAESESSSSPLLQQALTACTMFDSLPSSVMEHLLSIRYDVMHILFFSPFFVCVANVQH